MAERNKKTNRTKLGLKVLGFIFTAGGLTCTVIGSASFFSALGSGELPTLFWLLIAGLPMLTIGASLLTFGFRKELSATAIQIARAGENSPTVAAQTVREGENSPIEPAPLPEQTPKKSHAPLSRMRRGIRRGTQFLRAMRKRADQALPALRQARRRARGVLRTLRKKDLTRQWI